MVSSRSGDHTGVLSERVDYFERLVPWLENLLADQSAGRAHLVRTYAHWTLLRRARHQARTSGRFTYGSSDNIRTKLRAVLRLLTWIDTQDLTLESLDQGALDRWLVTQPRTSGAAARQFVGWARRAGLTGDIDISKPKARTTLDPIGEHDRWDHLRRLLTDEQLPLDTRAAGSVVLLYGLPVSRISELRADQLTSRDGHSYLNFGAHSLLLPPAVAVLLERHARHAISVTFLHRSNPTGPPWLFPGGLPGRPARDVLYRKLRAAIPHIRRSRSAALIRLAAELPAPILADLLDLNINTAVQWTQNASRDWSHYLQARTGTTTSTTWKRHRAGRKRQPRHSRVKEEQRPTISISGHAGHDSGTLACMELPAATTKLGFPWIVLHHWRDNGRDTFAALNAYPEVADDA